MLNRLSIVLSENRTPTPESAALLRFLAARLARRSELDVIRAPHLYDLAPDGSGFARLRAVQGDLVVLAWLYPRAIYWLLAANGVCGRFGRTAFLSVEEMPDDQATSGTAGEGSEPSRAGRPGDEPPTPAAGPNQTTRRTLWCIDLRGVEHPGRLLDEIDRIALEATGAAPPAASPVDGEAASAVAPSTAAESELAADRRESPEPPAVDGAECVVESTRRRWYPVVDRGRCSDCLECLNFCLFGVFGLDQAGALLVEQPDACRDGCPACARVCPNGAIMFPMHANPAIAGDPALPLAAFQQDVVQFLGGAAGRSGAPGSARTVAAAERERYVARPPMAPGGKPSAAPAAGAPAAEPAAPSDAPGGARHSSAQPPAPAPSLDDLVDRLDQSDL